MCNIQHQTDTNATLNLGGWRGAAAGMSFRILTFGDGSGWRGGRGGDPERREIGKETTSPMKEDFRIAVALKGGPEPS